LALFEELITKHPSVKGGMSRSAYEQDVQSKTEAAKAYDAVRKAHKEDFDLLKPKMSELWSKLPENAKVPEMVETIYLAARAVSGPKLREQIIEEMRSGSSTGLGANPPAGGTGGDKEVDAIVEEHKKTKKW